MNEQIGEIPVHDLVRKYHSKGRALLFSFAGATDVEEASEGCWIFGRSGRKYLDFGSYSVFLLGHRHPRIVEAVIAQLHRLPGTSRSFPTFQFALACESIAKIAPTGLTKVMLLNSGAEAVEAAAKLARAYTKRTVLVHLENSYHGKTFGALSLTDAEIFRNPFAPLLPETVRVSKTDPQIVKEVLLKYCPAAIFIEPIQGEGGIFEIEASFLRQVREACSETGTLLVFDEIQCGLGRSGTLWASELSGVNPDILLLGKALGGGIIPVSSVVATPEVFAPFDLDPILHTSTFGGNPLAASAVNATIDILKGENIPNRVYFQGQHVKQILDDLVAQWSSLFYRVSGRGLMLGLHCIKPYIAGNFLRHSLKEGILLSPCLTSPGIIRITPPAIVGEDEIEFARAALRAASALTHNELFVN